MSLPDDLRWFYERHGSVFFRNCDIGIVAPERFLKSNLVVLGEDFDECLDDPSWRWYVVAEGSEASTDERISIDLGPQALGHCYDSFWDVHGIAGSMMIVALTFTDLLRGLASADSNAEGPYWKQASFEPLGDAYEGLAAGERGHGGELAE